MKIARFWAIGHLSFGETEERLWQQMRMYPHLLETPAEIFNRNYPIVQAEIYQSGMMLLRESHGQPMNGVGGKRKKISYLSRQSLSKLAFLVASTPITFKSLITLTYSQQFPMNGQIVKDNLNSFLIALKRQYGSLSYLWFLEFQKRGAPHLHILTTIPKINREHREWLAETWVNIQNIPDVPYWSFVREKPQFLALASYRASLHWSVWQNVRKPDGAKRYALSYALKPYQKEVPSFYQDVGRFWGNSRDVKPEALETIDVTEGELREYLASRGLSVANSEILPKRIIIYQNQK